MHGLIADLFKEFMGPLGLGPKPAAPVAASRSVAPPHGVSPPSQPAPAPTCHAARTPPRTVTASTLPKPKPVGKTRRSVAALLSEARTSDSDADSEGSSNSSSTSDADHRLSTYAARASQRLVSTCSFFSVQHCHVLQEPLGTTVHTSATGRAVGQDPNMKTCWKMQWQKWSPMTL